MKRVSLRTLAIGLLALALPVSTVMADFEEAQAYIDLDGSLVGYINFEDDGKKNGAALNEIYQQVQTRGHPGGCALPGECPTRDGSAHRRVF